MWVETSGRSRGGTLGVGPDRGVRLVGWWAGFNTGRALCTVR